MAMDDLFQALRMFQDGAKEYATGNAIRSAAENVKQINSIQQDEFVKRQQLEETGKQLALQLGSMGAPVSQIQSSVGAIMPQQLNSPDAFFQQSLTATNPEAAKDLASAGMAFQKYLAKAPLTTAQQEQMKLGWAQLFGQQQALGTTAGSGKIKPMEMSEVKGITDIENELVSAQSLLRKVETNPDLAGPINNMTPWIRSKMNPEFSAFAAEVGQGMDAYRQRITGAGASDAERIVLESRKPNITDTPAQFIANTKLSLAIGERVRLRNLENYARAGRDVSGFNAKPVTSYGKMLKSIEPQIKEIENAQDALSRLLQTNPNDPRIDTFRDSIKRLTKKIGVQ